MNKVEIYTDGACKGNPGPGGWGALMRSGEHEKKIYGGELETTNNRMELTAAIEGLKALKKSCQVELTTDSSYVKNGIQTWMDNWKAKGWKTANRKPVKNKDLWQALDEEVSRHQVNWHWVKGHSGHTENEIADELANLGVDKVLAENDLIEARRRVAANNAANNAQLNQDIEQSDAEVIQQQIKIQSQEESS